MEEWEQIHLQKTNKEFIKKNCKNYKTKRKHNKILNIDNLLTNKIVNK